MLEFLQWWAIGMAGIIATIALIWAWWWTLGLCDEEWRFHHNWIPAAIWALATLGTLVAAFVAVGLYVH